MTCSNEKRHGTILIFFIAAMAIVSVLVVSLLKTQAEQATGVSVAEARLIADTLALSGIEIMATIDDKGPSAELTNRYRSFPDANQYGFGRLFGLDSSPVQNLLYMPPLEYPAIRGVAMRFPTEDVPGVAFNNDIRLMNVLCGLPVNVTLTVPGTTIAGNNGGAVLPTTACRPQPPDPEHDDFPVNAGSRYITALNHNTIGWYAPKNSPAPLPNTAKITGVAGSQKVPPHVRVCPGPDQPAGVDLSLLHLCLVCPS
ncbi:MAG: hypothetical protein HY814_13155 [Candidatus Riflebacteria bacterium]|nr:hypothetical protein [Candidatus Riflebacteria bacterium]